jgi:hypothetical protein
VEDLEMLREFEAHAARARLEFLKDPSALLVLVASGACTDFATYREIVSTLRRDVRAAAQQHWALIQDAGDWRAVFDLARRWLGAQRALWRLAFAGYAREWLHLVDLIDADAAFMTIQRFS